MTFRYWRRKLLFVFLLFVLIIVLYYNQKRFNNFSNKKNLIIGEESHSSSTNGFLLSKLVTIESNVIDIEGIVDHKLIELTELKKCDTCLGNSFCQSFKSNQLVINTPFVTNGIKCLVKLDFN